MRPEKERSDELLLIDSQSDKQRIEALERQSAAMMKWSADVSVAINNMQLQQEGLSPLQKHFGKVLGVRLHGGRR